ncbi:MAG: hypothetical protein PF517_04465 [Salinivirgaceae bacterium]|jgi:MFS family permease|nr:hypothetical protein [Salinivirgaceae bacterium]
MLFMPIVVLFYEDNGLSPFHIFLLQGIYSIAIAGLEIPSGYFADVLGRTKTLVFGSFLGFLGFAVYSISHGFIGHYSLRMPLTLAGSIFSFFSLITLFFYIRSLK